MFYCLWIFFSFFYYLLIILPSFYSTCLPSVCLETTDSISCSKDSGLLAETLSSLPNFASCHGNVWLVDIFSRCVYHLVPSLCYVHLWHFGRGGVGTKYTSASAAQQPPLWSLHVSANEGLIARSCVCMYVDQCCHMYVSPQELVSHLSCCISSPCQVQKTNKKTTPCPVRVWIKYLFIEDACVKEGCKGMCEDVLLKPIAR